MNNYLVNNVPTPIVGIIIVTLVSGVAVGGLMLVRRSVTLSTLESHNEVAGFIIAVVGVLYAVLLAFVVITVWERLQQARHHSELEAAYVVSMYRDATVHPASAPPIKEAIRVYANSVVHDEWPQVAKTYEGSPKTEVALDRLWQIYLPLNPLLPSDQIFYLESVDRLQKVTDVRQERIFQSKNNVPGVLWIALALGAAITIGFTYFFAVKSAAAEILMTLALASMIALTLFVVLVLDHPFSGDLGVKSDAMSDVIQQDFPRLDALTPHP